MSQVPEIDIASYLSSAFARPNDERVLLSAWQLLLFDMVRNAVLIN